MGPVLVTLSLVFRAVCVCVERCLLLVTLSLMLGAVYVLSLIHISEPTRPP